MTEIEVLEDIWERNENDLEDIRDVSYFLSEECLDIYREQHLDCNGWTTGDYTFVLQTGGPHVEVNDKGYLTVSWSDAKYDGFVSRMARECLRKVAAYLDEVWSD